MRGAIGGLGRQQLSIPALTSAVSLAFLVVLHTLASCKKRLPKTTPCTPKAQLWSRSHISSHQCRALLDQSSLRLSPPSPAHGYRSRAAQQARPAELDTLLSSPDQYSPRPSRPLRRMWHNKSRAGAARGQQSPALAKPPSSAAVPGRRPRPAAREGAVRPARGRRLQFTLHGPRRSSSGAALQAAGGDRRVVGGVEVRRVLEIRAGRAELREHVPGSEANHVEDSWIC